MNDHHVKSISVEGALEPDKDTVAILNPNHDLSGDSDVELAHIMERLCNEYQMCRCTLSTATLDVWNCIVRVAKEILKREGGELDEISHTHL